MLSPDAGVVPVVLFEKLSDVFRRNRLRTGTRGEYGKTVPCLYIVAFISPQTFPRKVTDHGR